MSSEQRRGLYQARGVLKVRSEMMASRSCSRRLCCSGSSRRDVTVQTGLVSLSIGKEEAYCMSASHNNT
jgi:hypothetical protein